MRLVMVKKRLLDGSECRKCVEATEHLKARGLWERVDEIVWAVEGEPASPGMTMSRDYGVGTAPFFVLSDERGTAVYASVLQLVRERLGQTVAVAEQAAAIDVDDIGGI
jgi:hypothetical protein